jgi:murein DD-endopeptidase MepM/ murein hydrolase activator NlpD
VPKQRRIFMETSATHLNFHEPRRRPRWPLLLSVVLLGALGLGFATYMEQPAPGRSASAALPADDTVRAATERTWLELAHEPLAPLAMAATVPAQPTAIPASYALPESTYDDALPEHAATSILDASSEESHTDPEVAAPVADALEWKEHVVASGDTLSAIFSQLEIRSHLQPILALGDEARDLQRLFPGERLRAGKREGDLETLIYEPRGDHYIEITRAGESGEFVAQRQEHELESQRRITHAEIQQSLFLDGSRAGLSDAMLIQIADIFGWDIDFAWDIRQGDHLIVVYDRIFKDGEHLRDGPVLAAEFQNRGRTLHALRFAPEGGNPDYFTPEGESMRQAFIRTPVDVGRISSSFGPRKHPVLGYTRQHQGVDYAAPTGTPIRAAGNGRIVHRGTRGGYGKTVIIDHGNNYRTLYAHMNGYRSGHSVGARVRQGEVIGYVGMTGLATGPHLHYEFHVREKPVNPVTVDLPRAESLPRKHMDAFREETASLLAAIESLRETQLAEGATGAGTY